MKKIDAVVLSLRPFEQALVFASTFLLFFAMSVASTSAVTRSHRELLARTSYVSTATTQGSLDEIRN